MAATQRRDFIEHAKLCDSAKRYDEMIDVLDQIIAVLPKQQTLTAEERKLLSIAYKNKIGPKRRSWKLLERVVQSRDLNASHRKLAKEYRNDVADEIKVVCNKLLELIDTQLVPGVGEPESDIFYHKLKGDYYRYLAEVEEDSTKVNEYVNLIKEHYQGATDYVEQNLAASHPLRLGLAMNFSVFIYDMLGDTDAAREHAKKFYDEALDEIESVREVDESRYNECVGLLRLLHENIKVWSPPGAPTTRRTNNPTTMAPTDNSLRAF